MLNNHEAAAGDSPGGGPRFTRACHTEPMSGMTDLHAMLASLRPSIRDELYVYVSVDAQQARELPASATIAEAEGVTVVLRKDQADAAGLSYHFVARWITLTLHSSLEAVGLTAAFAQALGAAGISCNVLAGYYHDHILVPADDADAAMAALAQLAN